MAKRTGETLKDENMEPIELEQILIDIFFNCDEEKRGYVEVSTLLKFIAPFIESNDELMKELANNLDPLDINPIINYELFANGMKIWVAKFNDQLQTSFSCEKSVTNKITDHRMSTPTKESIEKGSHRQEFDFGLNLSNVSSCSYTGSLQSVSDPVFLNDQINELQHQNKKLLDMLNEVKKQLAASEEANSTLQYDLERLNRSRTNEQKLTEELHKLRLDFEKEHEENTILVKNQNSLVQSLTFYKKENCKLKTQNLEMENKLQKNHDIITICKNKETKLNLKNESQKQEIQIKIAEILSFQDKIEELNTVCHEKESVIHEMNEELQNLRHDNFSLQKCLDDITNKKTSRILNPLKPGTKSCVPYLSKYKTSLSSTPTSLAPNLRNFFNFSPISVNSPKTIKMISNPISPISKHSPGNFSDSSKSTVREQAVISKIKISDDKNSSEPYHVHICPKQSLRSFSETDVPNLSCSSVESETNHSNRGFKSLGADMVFDEDCFLDKSGSPVRPQSPYESLQTELIKASKTECFGSHTYCEHKLKVMHYEENIDFLQEQIRKNVEEIETLNKTISDINNSNSKLHLRTNEMQKINDKLDKKLENYEKENHKLLSDIASFKSESKRYSRFQQKIKKLEDENFDVKAKCERLTKQNNNLINELKESTLKLNDIKQMEEELIENTKLKIQIDELSARNKVLEQINESVKEEISEEKKYLKDLNLEINNLEREKTKMGEKFNHEENISKELTLLKQDLEEKLSQEKINSKKLIYKIDSLKKINENLQEKLRKERILKEEIKEKFEKMEQNLTEKLLRDDTNLNKLNLKVNVLLSEMESLKKEKQELENKLKETYSKETELANVTKVNQQLEEKLFVEEINSKELKLKLNELTVKIDLLEKTKEDLEKKYFKEKNDKDNLQQIKLELEQKLLKLETHSKQFKLKFNELEKNKRETEEKLNEENNVKNLEIKELMIKIDVLEQSKYQFGEKLSKEESYSTELKEQLNSMYLNIEHLQEANCNLDNELKKENSKLQTLSVLLNKLTKDNVELKSENESYITENNKLAINIGNLEKKIQNFRKVNVDLKTSNSQYENNLNMITREYNLSNNHINFAKQQIKDCVDVLRRNTLLATNVWKTNLSDIVKELSTLDLNDTSSLTGMMKISKGTMTEDLKILKNQTRFTGILLKALAKIKQNDAVEESEDDAELSAVISVDSLTNTSLLANSQSFSAYLENFPSYSSSPSPDCILSDMAEEEGHISCIDFSNDMNHSMESVFVPEPPASNEAVETAEENGRCVGDSTNTEDKRQNFAQKQFRSMSEGTTIPPTFTDNGDIILFPNLQDNVLESLGLQNGEQSRDRTVDLLSEEEIEAKFQTLALIFAIDAISLNARRELQRRQRDQADDNFAAEVARLQVGIQRLAPLCTDVETSELMTTLLNRLKIIVKAAQQISISTQVYGGVQQEYRVTAAVNLMLVHLRNVQQQRDTAKRQLQCTKKMLQENTVSGSTESGGVVNVVSRRLSTTVNGRVVTRRRASIATIPRPLDSPSASGPAGIAVITKRAVRRISADVCTEYSAKHWDSRPRPEWIPMERPSAIRSSRPNRLELGLDLSKIHEGSIESTMNNHEESDTELTAFETPTAVIPSLFLVPQILRREPETFSDHAIVAITGVVKFLAYCWNRWIRNGSTQQVILVATFVCFALGIVIFLNLMIMSKLTRQGTVIQRIPWNWLTWDEFWNFIFEVRITRPY